MCEKLQALDIGSCAPSVQSGQPSRPPVIIISSPASNTPSESKDSTRHILDNE